MLKRHEVEILLKAGHPQTEVARLTGVSVRSVQRMAEEAPIEHVDDAAERSKRRIGRPSVVEDSKTREATGICAGVSETFRILSDFGRGVGRDSACLRFARLLEIPPQLGFDVPKHGLE